MRLRRCRFNRCSSERRPSSGSPGNSASPLRRASRPWKGTDHFRTTTVVLSTRSAADGPGVAMVPWFCVLCWLRPSTQSRVTSAERRIKNACLRLKRSCASSARALLSSFLACQVRRPS